MIPQFCSSSHQIDAFGSHDYPYQRPTQEYLRSANSASISTTECKTRLHHIKVDSFEQTSERFFFFEQNTCISFTSRFLVFHENLWTHGDDERVRVGVELENCLLMKFDSDGWCVCVIHQEGFSFHQGASAEFVYELEWEVVYCLERI